MRMTNEELATRMEEVQAMEGIDDEAAHIAWDKLYEDVLATIASGTNWQAELAIILLGKEA